MENKPALTQEQRLAYIGDMADLETREFTMRKAVEDLKATNDYMRADLKKLATECHALEQERDRLHRVFQEKHPSEEPPAEPEKPEGYDQFQKKYNSRIPNARYITVGGIIGRFFAVLGISVGFLLMFCGAILTPGIEAILTKKMGFNTLLCCVILLSCICSFFIVFLPYIIGYSRYRNHKKVYSQYLPYMTAFKEYKAGDDSYQYHFKNYAQAELKYQEKNYIYKNAQHRYSALIDAFNAQINRLQESIQSLHSQKQELYALNIIPPDYREMDCVIMLHQIFTNGLKDNIADAILLYEERIFRQEIIRGIDKIYDMLGQLNDSMRAIESRLIEVKQELQMIGSDMSNQLATITDNQSRLLSEMEDASRAQEAYAAAQEQWQREQLAETRASRYAAEAVQRSNEKYEWYMEQHRQGLL